MGKQVIKNDIFQITKPLQKMNAFYEYNCPPEACFAVTLLRNISCQLLNKSATKQHIIKQHKDQNNIRELLKKQCQFVAKPNGKNIRMILEAKQ